MFKRFERDEHSKKRACPINRAPCGRCLSRIVPGGTWHPRASLVRVGMCPHGIFCPWVRCDGRLDATQCRSIWRSVAHVSPWGGSRGGGSRPTPPPPAPRRPPPPPPPAGLFNLWSSRVQNMPSRVQDVSSRVQNMSSRVRNMSSRVQNMSSQFASHLSVKLPGFCRLSWGGLLVKLSHLSVKPSTPIGPYRSL